MHSTDGIKVAFGVPEADTEKIIAKDLMTLIHGFCRISFIVP